MGNLNKPVTCNEFHKQKMRYGLPTLFRRVELALVQQTIEQTYKFTGSQRECSFMLMVSCFSIFFMIEAFIFRTVSYDTSSRFYDVIAQITVAGLTHTFIFSFKIAGIIIIPDNAAIFCESIGILKSLDRTDFSKNSGRVYLSNSRDGIKHCIFIRI